MSILVEFRNLSYKITERTILNNVSLQVEEGETVVLLGRSGSGKTTLLKTVNRLVEPTGGGIHFEGEPVLQRDPIKLRRRIGYVIQDAGLFPHYTVERNIGLVPMLEHWPEDKIRSRVSELLTMVGLAPETYAKRYPRELSGGQRQRVGIARALAADPPLLLLDEPFAALDPVTRFDMQRQFLSLRDSLKKTALFVTHDIREALLLGTRIALLKDGTLDFVARATDFPAGTSPEAKAFLATLDDGLNLHHRGEIHTGENRALG
jgi:osmoprotectant transport system ATP-binding protein